MIKTICRIALLILSSLPVKAQLCTFPGQTPETAVLVCGSETFYQYTPTYCGIIDMAVPCPGGFTYQNNNPSFFRMACFTSGTLGFLITPDDPMANYNWQLFDITNTNPNSVFTVPSLFVACNWSSEPGETGATADGTSLIVCGGSGGALFSMMPGIVAGRSYMLMISNQSASPFGYQLTFTGGTASITDNIEPHLQKATVGCSGNTVVVRLNKKITCGSITPDGSDFSISGGITILSAAASDCSSLLGTDSVILTLSQPLPFGNYTLSVVNGTDGNTLEDICNRLIPEGETVGLSSGPLLPTPLDSVFKTGCAPTFIELVFRKPIRCNSIAPDGSDFIVTGPQAVSSTVMLTSCNTQQNIFIIRLNFTTPLLVAGTYRVELTTGTDGNTILDICGQPTPAGSAVLFNVDDPLSSLFTMDAPPSCKETRVSFFHDGNNNTASWKWDFGDGSFSTEQNPVRVYTVGGQYRVKLTVANNKCIDTSSQEITITGSLEAAFDAPKIICPADTIRFINKSTGGFTSWKWNFGNGVQSTEKNPGVQKYPLSNQEIYYTVSLVASNTLLNCHDTVTQLIKSLSNCYIAVPAAFTPNGDGRNDYLYPLNALKADQLEFRVFNRYGQQVFATRDWTKKWDGRINGVLQQTGVYAWLLSYIHHDTGVRVFTKGTVLLLN